jgi:phosphate transport system permease protein
VLPGAVSGIVAAVVLSVGRIVGESAAVMLTAGTVQRMPDSLLSGGKTLAVHLYILAKEGVSLEKAFASASVLIFVAALINFGANRLARFSDSPPRKG